VDRTDMEENKVNGSVIWEVLSVKFVLSVLRQYTDATNYSWYSSRIELPSNVTPSIN